MPTGSLPIVNCRLSICGSQFCSKPRPRPSKKLTIGNRQSEIIKLAYTPPLWYRQKHTPERKSHRRRKRPSLASIAPYQLEVKPLEDHCFLQVEVSQSHRSDLCVGYRWLFTKSTDRVWRCFDHAVWLFNNERVVGESHLSRFRSQVESRTR